jgi:hypothetical protein
MPAAADSEHAPQAASADRGPRVVHIVSVASSGAAPVEQAAQATPVQHGGRAAAARSSRYDRVLAFSDALARCGQEPYFARLVCEERARRRFCDGASDLPQCASAPLREYGN